MRQISRQEADAALAQSDWVTAQMYGFQLQGADPEAAEAWLAAIESAASPSAQTGEKHAQSVLGFVSLTRFWNSAEPNPEDFRRALHWYIAAARQDDGEILIHLVMHWYAWGEQQSLKDSGVEAFLGDPEIRERLACLPKRPPETAL
jgi:TPR repeat protein